MDGVALPKSAILMNIGGGKRDGSMGVGSCIGGTGRREDVDLSVGTDGGEHGESTGVGGGAGIEGIIEIGGRTEGRLFWGRDILLLIAVELCSCSDDTCECI